MSGGGKPKFTLSLAFVSNCLHARRAGENVGRLMPGGEVHDIMPPGPDLDEIPFAEWEWREGQLAEVFLDFLKRADATTQRTTA